MWNRIIRDSAKWRFWMRRPGSFCLKNIIFIVVGLIKKADNFQPVIETLQDYETYTREEYGMVLIPDADWPILYNYDEPQDCVVRAVSTERMSEVGRKVEQIMKRSVGGSSSGEDAVSYKAEDLLEKARNKQELANSTNSLLIWIASIALLVGGIGVMNIMLVSVTERTNEIGLKKALGARNSRILAQFLTEAVVLTSLGGIIGVISGIILAEVISKERIIVIKIRRIASVNRLETFCSFFYSECTHYRHVVHWSVVGSFSLESL